MIQRIQSVWLFLAALVVAGMFYFNVYNITSSQTVENYARVTSIKNDFLAMALAGASVLMSLVTIFLFKNRKTQINLTWLNILTNIGLLFWLFVKLNGSVWSAAAANTVAGYISVGMFLPLVAVILLIMALRGIRKDEKLIRSLDRLR